ncbi:HxlR family transcriptional regulator [Halomonas cupida]|uniref:HxlR family transcriptional regulator n=1 Tax=Halomonas cupida TaxID=44933 RepID=A0A1M7JTE6_9GAMM|nr:helix-turn-helix domain-containing protein [Halomonas cupida]GEN24488.1 HxlR family transcriptional regulator [Halomonas cupida]SHM56191.1 transcriptional regulator, HxlR family [Halomonas cupida]
MAEDTALPNDFFAEARTTRLILSQIADKWSVMILTILCSGPARFNAIKKRLDGITHKALTEALRRLERNGLLIRTVLSTSPVAVEYSITELGHSLREPFSALYKWSLEHSSEVIEAQQRYDKRSQGST